VTRTPKVALNDVTTYAMGWVISATPNGRAVWHNGGTSGFGAHIGFLPGRDVGVIVLTNLENKGFPDAIGLWIYDRLLGNPAIDHMHDSVVGDYDSDELGPATLATEGGGLALTVRETGARLRLRPFDGAVFTAHLVPEGRFAPIVAAQGDAPFGFADLAADLEGRLTRLRWTIEGQAHVWAKRRTRPTSAPEPKKRAVE
jgi:hypothetical protein